jgi:hypothetical protein
MMRDVEGVDPWPKYGSGHGDCRTNSLKVSKWLSASERGKTVK